MEPKKYFIIARVSRDFKWDIISHLSENRDEIQKLYDGLTNDALYSEIKIAETIYG